jgi:hypothetical protein
MPDILVGALLGAVGLYVCFAGLRTFLIVLPVIGFISGFFIGAAGVRTFIGEGFLGSVTGVIVGLLVGLLLAVLSYVLWYVGALLTAGSTGALFGSAIMNGIGVDSGWLVFIGAAIGAVLIFAIAFKLALPVYVVIINTAILGASGAVTGLLLVINQVDRADLGYGLAWATIEESWLWLVAWLVLAVAGIVAQVNSISNVTLPEERWASAHAA